MKKMIFLLLMFSVLNSIVSCNKDIQPDKDDLPDKNFRILKVEQTNQLITPPFLFGASQNEANTNMIRVEYEYIDNLPTIAQISQIDKPEVKYPVSFSSNGLGVYSLDRPPLLSFFEKLGTIVNGINKTTIEFADKNISSIRFEVNSGLLYEGTSQVRRNIYEFSNNKIRSTTSFVEFSMYPGENAGDTLGWSIIDKWDGNHLLSYKSFDDLGSVAILDDRLAEGTFIGSLIKGNGKECNIFMTYSEVPYTMPKELVRRVNQLLSGILRGPFEDYVFNWQIDFLYSGNTFLQKYINADYKSYAENLQSSSKTVLADWLWSFAHPSFNVLPDQDKIISSKRITGRKIVDIIDDQPVYQDIDSTATFPYVFDPVDKTLEIAGLKIWYEVLE
jgi:hypothetical protein